MRSGTARVMAMPGCHPSIALPEVRGTTRQGRLRWALRGIGALGAAHKLSWNGMGRPITTAELGSIVDLLAKLVASHAVPPGSPSPAT